jgi:hypothetical protein
MYLRRQGDLVLAENDPLATQIQRKLREIDGRLFLEKQIRLPDQRPCWYVMHGGSLDEEPLALMEWSGPDGVPLELSWSLVDRVIAHRLDRSPQAKLAHQHALKANERWQESRSRSSENEYEAVSEEVVPLLNPVHSAVLPRGVHLRMHRDKMRARGMKA